MPSSCCLPTQRSLNMYIPVLLRCFYTMYYVMPFVVAVVPWSLGPRPATRRGKLSLKLGNAQAEIFPNVFKFSGWLSSMLLSYERADIVLNPIYMWASMLSIIGVSNYAATYRARCSKKINHAMRIANCNRVCMDEISDIYAVYQFDTQQNETYLTYFGVSLKMINTYYNQVIIYLVYYCVWKKKGTLYALY